MAMTDTSPWRQQGASGQQDSLQCMLRKLRSISERKRSMNV